MVGAEKSMAAEKNGSQVLCEDTRKDALKAPPDCSGTTHQTPSWNARAYNGLNTFQRFYLKKSSRYTACTGQLTEVFAAI